MIVGCDANRSSSGTCETSKASSSSDNLFGDAFDDIDESALAGLTTPMVNHTTPGSGHRIAVMAQSRPSFGGTSSAMDSGGASPVSEKMKLYGRDPGSSSSDSESEREHHVGDDAGDEDVGDIHEHKKQDDRLRMRDARRSGPVSPAAARIVTNEKTKNEMVLVKVRDVDADANDVQA